jgi:hypothetical protein
MSHPNFHVEATGDTVQLWSIRRLPFEPKGWLKEMKLGLRAGLQQLQPSSPDDILSCRFTSKDSGVFDLENVLLYNVGSGGFARTAKNELRLSRTVAAPPDCPVALSSVPLCFHQYQVRPVSTGLPAWTRQPLASWRFTLPRTRGDRKPHQVWWAMKGGECQSGSRRLGAGRRFGLVVTYQTPKPVNLAGKIKVLLDGVVSGLHSMPGSVEPQVLAWLAVHLSTNEAAIAAALRDESNAVLGNCSLVRLFSDGVQWHPRDDLCDAVVFKSVVKPGSEEGCWGAVYELDLSSACQA